VNFVDTNLVIRYLTNDEPSLAERAARVIDSDSPVYLTDVVIAEIGYVLTSIYEMQRPVVIDHLIALLQKRNIRTFGFDKNLALQALILCRPSHWVSFADAMLWASARSAVDGVIYTFDQHFPENGVELKQP
jgi:predicted nucleic acid-binding protein